MEDQLSNNQTRPKVSVCVPVYNVEEYIGRCIESIQGQTLKEIEIVVVNDCTPDKSMQIVNKYALEDKRIRIINHKKNQGLMRARQTGYLGANGDYITFCDSDDFLPLNALELLYIDAIQNNADVVSGAIIMHNGTSIIPGSEFPNEEILDANSASIFKALISGHIGHNLCSKLFKRDILQHHNYITYDNHTNGEDAMLFYQVIKYVNKISTVKDVVYYYYTNPESSSNNILSEKAINCMFITLATIYHEGIRYSEMRKLLINYVYNSISTMCACGAEPSRLKYYIKKYQMELSLSPLSIILSTRWNSIRYIYRLYIRRYTHFNHKKH